MMEGRDWYWVTGSDTAATTRRGIGGTVVPQLLLNGDKFRAEAIRAHVANEIAGGLHPVAQISQYGHLLRGRCFVTNGMRLIMPAVGNYSAGEQCARLRLRSVPRDRAPLFVWFLAQSHVHPVAPPQLIEDCAA